MSDMRIFGWKWEGGFIRLPSDARARGLSFASVCVSSIETTVSSALMYNDTTALALQAFRLRPRAATANAC